MTSPSPVEVPPPVLELARAARRVCEVDPRETEVSGAADHTWRVTAATALPALVAVLGA